MRPIDADSIKIPHLRLATDTIKMIDAIDEAPTIKTKQIKYFDEDEKIWKIGEVIINSSEKPTGSERSSE